MDSDRYKNVARLFDAACARKGVDLVAFLDESCQGDPALRGEIESLLACDREAGGFIGTPALGSDFDLRDAAGVQAPSLVGRQVGAYHLTRLVASGGMGTVYEAQQDHPARTVALKVMRVGVASNSALRRFQHESQILARLQHPGIAHVYAAGIYTDGAIKAPYFAMELIAEAKDVIAYAAAHHLGTRRRLELFSQVCDAVHYGHQRGVIHRDIKPSNILVDGSGRPKVIDFGVARATDSDVAVTTVHTDVGQVLGTLQYMSPEQCDADPHDLDIRTDVYALGVVLYELLCGQLPYDVSKSSISRAASIIREQAPRKLSTINRSLRGDIETITLTALEKDRERRYQSAADLAQDIRRYLNHQPIEARAPSKAYLFRKLIVRHKREAVLAALFLLSLVGFSVGMTVLYLKAGRAQQTAQGEAETATQLLASVVQLMQNLDPTRVGEPGEFIGPAGSPLEILDRSAATIAEQLADQPAAQAELLTTLGTVYRNQGHYRRAKEVMKRALDLHRELFGREHPKVAESLYNYAVAANDTGETVEAERLYRQSISMRRTLLGDDHPDLVSSLLSLAGLLVNNKDKTSAQALAREAMAIARGMPNEERQRRAYLLGQAGRVLSSTGNHTEAESVYREALELLIGELGDDHPAVWHMTANMAQALNRQGKPTEAERLLRDVLQRQRDRFGEEHLQIAGTLRILSTVLVAQGRREEAQEQWQEVLRVYRRLLGNEHSATASVLSALAYEHRLRGDHDAAERDYREALAIYRKLDSRASIAGVLHELAKVMSESENLKEAERLGLECLAIRRELYGNTNLDVAGTLLGLAKISRDQFDYVGAEVYVREALAIRENLLGPDDPQVADAVLVFGGLMVMKGDWPAAERLYSQALDVYRKQPGDEYVRVPQSLTLLGRLLWVRGDYAGAEPLLREALAIHRARLGDYDPEVGADLYNLAQVLVGNGDAAAIESLFEQAWAQREHAMTLPEDHPNRSGSSLLLGVLHMSKDELQEAEVLLQECVANRRQYLPEDNWMTAYAESVLAECQTRSGRYSEAEELLLRAFPIVSADRGGFGFRTQEVLGRIIDLYDAWGKPDQRAQYESLRPNVATLSASQP